VKKAGFTGDSSESVAGKEAPPAVFLRIRINA